MTSIEWTDVTWNPVTGCDRVSPGCDHCYAATMAARLKAMGQPKYQRDGDPRTSGPGFGVAQHNDVLDQPLRWRTPRRVFVNSMSDLFHPRVTDEFIAAVFGVMMAAPRHTFQVLTKRPKRMRALLNDGDFDAAVAGWWEHYAPPSQRGGLLTPPFPSPNVWLGISIEDDQRADERLPDLWDTPAAVRFVSCEPLLGPVNLMLDATPEDIRPDWVIVGGESGPGARPMHPAWARDLRRQCSAVGVPFLFKQWGAWAPIADVYDEDLDVGDLLGRHTAAVELGGDVPQEHLADGITFHVDHQPAPGSWWMERVGKKAAGRELDGRTWDEFPAAVEVTA